MERWLRDTGYVVSKIDALSLHFRPISDTSLCLYFGPILNAATRTWGIHRHPSLETYKNQIDSYMDRVFLVSSRKL